MSCMLANCVIQNEATAGREDQSGTPCAPGHQAPPPMPPLTKFIDCSSVVVAGKFFSFCSITNACGVISGFHSLIASGVTPRIITREAYVRPIVFGAMCLESLVAIMAMIAARIPDPRVYRDECEGSLGRSRDRARAHDRR